ncbi:MAG: HNH endonuclease [Oscillospiraceae bacterium]
MISDARRIQLNAMIQAGKSHDFYSWPEWDKLRREVMKLDNYECQRCKGIHRHRRATIVHHVKHLKDRPDLALSVYDGDDRQLVSVCKQCHEELHPESQRQFKKIVAPLTLERWD